MHMRVLCVLALLVSPLAGQGIASLNRGQDIAAGVRSAKVVLTLDTPPEIGDAFFIDVSSDKITTALLLPDGDRVLLHDGDRVDAVYSHIGLAAYAWWNTPPLGRADGSYLITLEFNELGKAGRYEFEFAAGATKTASHVNVSFKSNRHEYDAWLRSAPGFLTVGPVMLNQTRPSATLDLVLPRQEVSGLFDVVVTDPGAKVSLALPGGRLIESAEGEEDGFEWKILQDANDLDALEPFLGRLLLHRDGTHHVFMFETALKGKYQVRAQTSAKRRVELTAAFIPVGGLLERGLQSLETIKYAPVGETFFQIYSTPEACFVGASFELSVGLTGEPVLDPKFKVQLEYRAPLGRGADGYLHWDEPIVEDANVTLTRTPEGRYVGRITPMRVGLLRVGVRVNGETTSGKSFSREETSKSIDVHR